MLVFCLAVVLALIASFLCSISEAVLLSVTHSQVEALGKSRAGNILRKFKREIDVPIAAILVLNTIANTVGAAVAGGMYPRVFDESTLWAFSLVFTLAILIFSEIIPKTLGVTFVSRLAVPVAHWVRALVWIFRPLLYGTRAISGLLRRGNELPVTSIDEIRLLAMLGRTSGALAARTAAMIEGAAALRELTAYDIMVPRAGIAYLSGTSTLEENLNLVRRTGHSRFPYTPDGNLDKVEGVILIKELLFRLRESDAPDYRSLLAPMLFVPESMPVERLLRTFQEERRHMALVVNEYGGTQGIVTLEDVLEEIVGEIEDESDRIHRLVIRRPDGSLICRGWAETRKVFDLLGIEVEEEEEEPDSVTVGGFVAELVGRVPKAGDRIVYKGYVFEVLRATQRRAERIGVRPARAEDISSKAADRGATAPAPEGEA